MNSKNSKNPDHTPKDFPFPLETAENKIGVKFKNKKLLIEALTHKSYAMETDMSIPFNERLEFLGDSILNAAVVEFLFRRFPQHNEGKLSKFKSLLVSKASLYKWGKEIKISSFLRMGESEEICGGRERDSNIANVMEAIIGALFLDQGWEPARAFVLKKFSQKKRIVETDYKSRLQELVQKKYRMPPQYTVIHSTGPEHAKTFHIEVRLKKQALGQGMGKSKKEAEQSAALRALRNFKKIKIHIPEVEENHGLSSD
jgi:ribonuclease-3